MDALAVLYHKPKHEPLLWTQTFLALIRSNERSYLVLALPHTHLCTRPAWVNATSFASAMIASSLAGLVAGGTCASSMAWLVAGMPAQQISATCLGACRMEVAAARHLHCFTDVCSNMRQNQQHQQADYAVPSQELTGKHVDGRCAV